MTQLPSRSSSRANRGRPAARIDEEPSLAPAVHASRVGQHRNRSSKRQAEATRRREESIESTSLRRQTDNAGHVAKRAKESPSEREARNQQNRQNMQQQRQQARAEVQQQALAASMNLNPGERPTPEILQQFEQNATAAQLFFADSCGFDVHKDVFDDEVANVRLDPVPFDNRASPVNDNDEVSVTTDDSAVSDVPALPPDRKHWTSKDRLRAFNDAMGPDIVISACASCGIKEPGTQYKCIPLSDIHCLFTEGLRLERYNQAEEFQDAFHVFEFEGNLYDVHHELILLPTLPPYVAPLRAPLCDKCYLDVSKNRRPDFNVGIVDYGRRIPLIDRLTEAEELAVSRCIRFQTILKLRSDSTPSARGHVINFPCDAPDAMAVNLLPRRDLRGFVNVAFVGSRALFAKRTAPGIARQRFLKAYPQLTVNVERVYRVLRLKQALDPAYAGIEIDESPETVAALEQFTTDLLDPDSVLYVDSREAMHLDALVESNVARPDQSLETQSLNHDDDDVDSSMIDENDGEMTMERIFVHPPVTAPLADVSSVLRAADRVVNGSDEGVNDQVAVTMDSTPVNEFGDADLYFSGSFPMLFLFGQGVDGNSGGLSSKQLRHMLLQSNNHFSCNAQFLFTVFNQLQRHAASRAVTLKAKGGQQSMQQFMDIVNAGDFSQRLLEAIQDPATAEAKSLAGAILSVARVPGATVPWSGLERKSAMGKLMAIVMFGGPFSIFGTIAPADMDSHLMLKLSCTPQTGETGSISTADASITFKLPSLRDRHRTLAKNPFAAAQVYKRLVENFFDILIGLPATHTTRKSPLPVSERGQGVLGVPIAFGGVTEEQSRHSPHLHFLLTTDVSPMTIQKYCDQPDIMKQLCRRLDSILRSELPINAKQLVEPLVSDNLSEPTPQHRDTRNPVDFQTATEDDVINRANAVAQAVNRHAHTLTCHKGVTGRYRCRLAMDRSLWTRDTEVIQLFATYDNTGKLVPKAMRSIQDRSSNVDPLRLWNDHRILVLELHRPHSTASADMHTVCPNAACADSHPNTDCSHEYYVDIQEEDPANMTNGNVVTFSPALSCILGCNTDIEPLGTFAQAKAAIFYLVKYLTKDGHDLSNVLSLIKAADDHCMRYPSKADDSGTTSRNSKYILTRLLNCLSREVEVGAQLASLALLDFPSNVFSHEFYYCFITPAVNYCKRIHKQSPPTPITSPVSATIAFASLTEDELLQEYDRDEDIGDPDDTMEAVGVDDTLDDDAENKEIVRDESDNIVFMSQALHYKYRAPSRVIRGEDPAIRTEMGDCCQLSTADHNHQCDDSCPCAIQVDDLGDLSLYEYTGIVRVRLRKQTKENAKRQNDKVYEFNNDHPGRTDRVQQLRSKQFIPHLAGRPSPPHPGPRTDATSWLRTANKFAAYAITLHYPWSLITLAPPIPLTWDALEVWVQELLHSGRYIDKARLHWLRLLAHGRTVKSETMKLLTAWRSRSATYWSKSDQLTAEREMGLQSTTDFELDLDELVNDLNESYSGLPPVEIGGKADVHRSVVISQLLAISQAVEKKQPTVYGDDTMQPFMRFDEVTPGQLTTTAAYISRKSSTVELFLNNAAQSTARIQPTASHVLPEGVGVQQTYDNVVPEDLNAEQSLAFSEVVSWANADAHYRKNLYSLAPTPLRLLISGAAGTGKTHLVRKLYECLGSNVIASVSITGVAASNLPKGATIHSTFALPINDRAKPSESAAFTNFGDARILIIDEISTTHADAFIWVSDILRRWFEANVSFGGLAVVAMGDFFQQGPVGRSLLQAFMIPGNAAGQLFKEFHRVEFTQQVRAADDIAHTTRLDFFRNPFNSLTPVSASKILNHVKEISSDDLIRDPKFLSAPIICSDNVTRHAINKLKIIELAKRSRSPVIVFRLPLANYAKTAFTASSLRTGKSYETLLDEHDNLSFYFVPGAPVMCKDNVSPCFGIANGSQAVLHSLSLNPEKVDVDEVWSNIHSTPPGEIFYLDELPLSVNIVLNNALVEFDPNTSLLPDLQVVPMLLNTRSHRKLKVAGKNNLRQLSYFDFGVDLAFSLTYYKVQGLTLDRIILDLNTTVMPKINVAALYVGLSRVRRADHIRILPLTTECRLALHRIEFKSYLVDWLKMSSTS